MLSRFKANIDQFLTDGRHVLLAVSGGRDSVAMTDLFSKAGLPFSIAHCNFHLRPGDCNRDQLFVRHLAEAYGVPFFTVDFDTLSYAHENGYSIEEAARRLRYSFFSKVCSENNISTLATAHHRDDSIETFFLNLFRGTGISGLHGIRPLSTQEFSQYDNTPISIIRPMLCFSRADIDSYIAANSLEYVEDHTNYELDARRNRIRLQLMPLLRELYPSIDNTMQANIERLYDTELLFHAHIRDLRQRLIHPYKPMVPLAIPMVYIPVNDLKKEMESLPASTRRTLLFELLRDYGFNASVVDDILLSLDSSGRLFRSSSHIAELHRGKLIIVPDIESRPPAIEIHPVDQPDPIQGPSTIVVDAAKLSCTSVSQLTIRPWCSGDRIRPFGMKGSKLVSDILKDMGMPLVERRNVYLLLDANGIPIWIIGLRADDRFRITGNTVQSFVISCSFT